MSSYHQKSVDRTALLPYRPRRPHRRTGLEMVVHSGLSETDDVIGSNSLCIWDKSVIDDMADEADEADKNSRRAQTSAKANQDRIWSPDGLPTFNGTSLCKVTFVVKFS